MAHSTYSSDTETLNEVGDEKKGYSISVHSVDEEKADASSTISSASTKNHKDTLDSEEDFPEGGLQAWLVTLAAFLICFVTFGLTLAIGTIQDYWQQNQLATYSPSEVGWISSIFTYLGLALGVAVGPVVDRYGPRYVLLSGSVAYIAAIFLLAECRVYWQFLLCGGFLAGTAASTLETTSLTIVAQWFNTNRALAQGTAMAGSALGGVLIPLLLRATLLTDLGYQWSVRIMGFVFLICLVVGNLLLKPRLHRSTSKKVPLVSWSLYRDARFVSFAISVFGIEMVLLGIGGILPTYITYTTDFAPEIGYYLITLWSAGSFFGRILPAYIADRIGRFNTYIIMILFTLISMLAIWLPFGGSSLPALYIFAVLSGFGTGSWMALVPASLGQLCRAEEFGQYFGSMYFTASLSILICLPVTGELLVSAGPQVMILFLCGMLTLSFISAVVSRWACLGWKWSWVARI